MAAIGFPALFVAFGISHQMYGLQDIFAYCWAAPTPFGCRSTDSCEHGNDGHAAFVWLTCLVEMNMFTSLKMGSVFALYWKLRTQQRIMETRYHVGSSATTSTTTNNNSAQKKPTNKSSNTGMSAVVRQTGIQAALFLVACIVPYGGAILLRWCDMFAWRHLPYPATTGFFAFSLVVQILFPLQGFCNLLVFLRPKWLQFHRDFPDEPSRYVAFWYLLCSTEYAAQYRASKQQQRLGSPAGLRSHRPLKGAMTSQDITSTRSSITASVHQDVSQSTTTYPDLYMLQAQERAKSCRRIGEAMLGDVLQGEEEEEDEDGFQNDEAAIRRNGECDVLDDGDDGVDETLGAISASVSSATSSGDGVTAAVAATTDDDDDVKSFPSDEPSLDTNHNEKNTATFNTTSTSNQQRKVDWWKVESDDKSTQQFVRKMFEEEVDV